MGGKRDVLFRRDDDFDPWESLMEVHTDDEVSDLVRLVPARPVVRDDLPDASVTTDKYGAMGSMYFPAVGDYRDAVVAHLNANGGVPDWSGVDFRSMYENVCRQRDDAHRAYEKAERERDEALVQLDDARMRAAAMQNNRDAWQERAEEARHDDA